MRTIWGVGTMNKICGYYHRNCLFWQNSSRVWSNRVYLENLSESIIFVSSMLVCMYTMTWQQRDLKCFIKVIL